MKPLSAVVVTAATLVATVSCQNGPPNFANNLSGCVNGGTKSLDSCLRDTLEELRTYMPTGIPELGLVPTEPLTIPYLPFRSGAGAVRIDSTFTDVS